MATGSDTRYLLDVRKEITMQVDRIERSGDIALILLGSNTQMSDVSPMSFVLNGRLRLHQLLKVTTDVFSGLYASPAFPAGIGPDFVNAAMAIRTTLSPLHVLDVLHKIEAEADRTREVRWGPRTLDLDLVAFGGAVSPDVQTQTQWRELPLEQQQTAVPGELILPHPRLQDRAFVLVPLAQVAPDWVHPVLGRSVIQMRDALPTADVSAVRPIAG
jgi:2-amino-4-hydroxy-6-hydroxymethyldihydropteridine diphosphokinase|tara:strand:+ start:644 stop:1291 length:648 start_codon:yes stop_codon:yes gene_type:complete